MKILVTTFICIHFLATIVLASVDVDKKCVNKKLQEFSDSVEYIDSRSDVPEVYKNSAKAVYQFLKDASVNINVLFDRTEMSNMHPDVLIVRKTFQYYHDIGEPRDMQLYGGSAYLFWECLEKDPKCQQQGVILRILSAQAQLNKDIGADLARATAALYGVFEIYSSRPIMENVKESLNLLKMSIKVVDRVAALDKNAPVNDARLIAVKESSKTLMDMLIMRLKKGIKEKENKDLNSLEIMALANGTIIIK